MLYQLSFIRVASLARCSGVSHDVLVVTARAYYVSPLVRRAFLHRYVLFSFVSPLSAGRFSINLVYQSLIMVDNNVLVCGRVFRTIVPLRLIIMDNNVRGHVLLITSQISCLLCLVVYNTACIHTCCYQSDVACTRYWLRLYWEVFCQDEVVLSPDITTTSSLHLQFQIRIFVDC